jgi:hypothetical protein
MEMNVAAREKHLFETLGHGISNVPLEFFARDYGQKYHGRESRLTGILNLQRPFSAIHLAPPHLETSATTFVKWTKW